MKSTILELSTKLLAEVKSFVIDGVIDIPALLDATSSFGYKFTFSSGLAFLYCSSKLLYSFFIDILSLLIALKVSVFKVLVSILPSRFLIVKVLFASDNYLKSSFVVLVYYADDNASRKSSFGLIISTYI